MWSKGEREGKYDLNWKPDNSRYAQRLSVCLCVCFTALDSISLSRSGRCTLSIWWVNSESTSCDRVRLVAAIVERYFDHCTQLRSMDLHKNESGTFHERQVICVQMNCELIYYLYAPSLLPLPRFRAKRAENGTSIVWDCTLVVGCCCDTVRIFHLKYDDDDDVFSD